MAVGVNAAVLVSAAVSLGIAPRLMRRAGDHGPEARGRRWARPEVFLALVVALVYVNQVLFTVYVLRVHGGDVSFIAKHLPEGWFALADGPLVQGAADRFPAPELLEPSVLRVQAFLELPLVLLAYVTVLRWLDRGLYRRLARSWLVWAASVSYTFVFCLVEWDLHNPYTVDDIVIRACSAVVTPPLLWWLAGHEQLAGHEEDGPGGPSVAQMLLFAVSVWALGHLVLTVYDTALLYNLGHLGDRLPGAVVAICALAGARWASSRLRPAANAGSALPSGSALASVAGGLRWALVLFFVPALAVRYGPNVGAPLVAAASGLAVCLVAAVCALREVLAGAGTKRIAVWAVQGATALSAGGAAGYAAVLPVTDTYYEAGLLRGAGACFAVVVAVCALTDRWARVSIARGCDTPAAECAEGNVGTRPL